MTLCVLLVIFLVHDIIYDFSILFILSWTFYILRYSRSYLIFHFRRHSSQLGLLHWSWYHCVPWFPWQCSFQSSWSAALSCLGRQHSLSHRRSDFVVWAYCISSHLLREVTAKHFLCSTEESLSWAPSSPRSSSLPLWENEGCPSMPALGGSRSLDSMSTQARTPRPRLGCKAAVARRLNPAGPHCPRRLDAGNWSPCSSPRPEAEASMGQRKK